MKYTFSLTGGELWEASVRVVLEKYRRNLRVWLTWLIACGLVFWFAGPLVWVLLLLLLVAVLLDIFMAYQGLKKMGLLEERSIETDGRYLKVSGQICSEVRMGSFHVIRSGRHLVMLGNAVSKSSIRWVILPARVFASEQEKEDFLKRIREDGAETDVDPEKEKIVPSEEPVFRFAFEMEKDSWMQIYAGALRALQSGAMGMLPRRKSTIGIYLIFLGLAAVFQGLFPQSRILIYTVPVFFLLLVHLLLSGREDPEKIVKKQLKAGNVQKNVCGRWELVLTQKGLYTFLGEGGKTFFPWEHFAWAVEAEQVLYLFQKNKSQFVPIPRERTESEEQWEQLKAFCVQRGLTYRQAKIKKPLPRTLYWLAMTGAFLAMVFATAGLLLWRDAVSDGSKAVRQQGEAYDSAADTEYVPLDLQVSVLRKIGFTVPEAVVENLRSYLAETDMREYIEGTPYLYLLSMLGTPAYDEDWQIVSWPEEVFWLDLEGYDISADYIDILKGMKALAKDSVPEGVENIREDTGRVDWEAGTGTITVLFTWQGEEYAYDMTVEYDWIDTRVFGIFNGLLEKTGEKRRFYTAWDGGQGALVFFRDEKWAEKFTGATGIELYAPVTENEKAYPAVIAVPGINTRPQS